MRFTGAKKIRYMVFLVGALLAVSGCGHLRTDFEDPRVKVVSLQALPAEGMEQSFAIGLRISNPNAFALNLVGMSYSLRLQGYDLLDGVANNIPEIPAYSEVPIEVKATVNMLNGLLFIRTILTAPQSTIQYELAAKLALDSRLLPTIRLVEKGNIALTQ